ncbi:MAG: Kelch repeat-containing protein [Jiangellaceae bacterium]
MRERSVPPTIRSETPAIGSDSYQTSNHGLSWTEEDCAHAHRWAWSGGMRSAARILATVTVLAVIATACSGAGEPTGIQSTSTTDTSAWERLDPAPSTRSEVGTATVGTRIHVIGGFDALGDSLATVEVFDTDTGQWEPGPDLPAPVNHAMAAAVGDAVYVFGGYRGRLTDVRSEVFRLDDGAWQEMAPMPEGRAAGTAIAADGTVYVAGGMTPHGDGPGTHLAEEMLVYDAAADDWSTAPGPPTPREHLGGAGSGGLVYTVGGRRPSDREPYENQGAFEMYDPATGQWSALADLPTPRGGLSAAATCSGHIVAVGGENLEDGGASTFAEVEAFDPGAGTWQALPPMPIRRHGLGVATVDTVLYTLAGGPNAGLTVSDITEAIDLAALGTCP